jgi:hypothetical protein
MTRGRRSKIKKGEKKGLVAKSGFEIESAQAHIARVGIDIQNEKRYYFITTTIIT